MMNRKRKDAAFYLTILAPALVLLGTFFVVPVVQSLLLSFTDAYGMQVYELGIRHIGLFLDDIPSELQHEQDCERYGSLASAHIDLMNRYQALLRQNFSEPITLCVCPWQYCGTGEEAYISELGRGIAPDVRLFWTGPQVCSQTLTGEQAARFETATGHRPLYWDNYPVNDSGMYREMHLSPLEGRSADLGAHCDGYVCNGMIACV